MSAALAPSWVLTFSAIKSFWTEYWVKVSILTLISKALSGRGPTYLWGLFSHYVPKEHYTHWTNPWRICFSSTGPVKWRSSPRPFVECLFTSASLPPVPLVPSSSILKLSPSIKQYLWWVCLIWDLDHGLLFAILLGELVFLKLF